MTKSSLMSSGAALAALVFFLATLVTPPPAGLSVAGWHTLGVAVLMGVLWISEAAPFAATALLPLVLFPMAGVSSIQAAAAPYANPVIYLFLGGIFIALAMERWNLHRRMALAIIRRAGTRRQAMIGGFLAASGFVSMWVNNTAVAVMMLPIGLSVLAVLGLEDEGPFATALLLAIAYGSNIGGMATLVGTAPNAILAGFLMENYGIQIGFLGWMAFALPLSVGLLVVAWIFLARISFRHPEEPIAGGEELLEQEARKLGRLSGAEKGVAIVFLATAALWVGRGFFEEWIPWLSDSLIAMAGGLSLFFLPSDRSCKSRLLDWHTARRIPWDVLLLIGGGLSLASAIQSNGLAGWIGGVAALAGFLPAAALVSLVVFLIVWLTEITSNSATTSTFLPIVAAMAVGLGEPPLAFAAAVALASSCAFMLPVATPPNAIVFGSGKVPLRDMMRLGVVMNFACWIILSLWIGWLAPRMPGFAQ